MPLAPRVNRERAMSACRASQPAATTTSGRAPRRVHDRDDRRKEGTCVRTKQKIGRGKRIRTNEAGERYSESLAATSFLSAAVAATTGGATNPMLPGGEGADRDGGGEKEGAREVVGIIRRLSIRIRRDGGGGRSASRRNGWRTGRPYINRTHQQPNEARGKRGALTGSRRGR